MITFRVRLAAALLVFAAARAGASPLRPFGLEQPADGFAPRPTFRLGPAPLLAAPLALDLPQDPPASRGEAPPRRVFDRKTALVTAGAVLAATTIGYFTWWRDGKGRFSFANEGWFERDTYAGGADKASHAVFSFDSVWGLEQAYRGVGHPDGEARWLALGTVVGTGLLLEAGDGFSEYGASWEDAAANAVGAGLSAFVSRYGLRDTIGMRFGIVKAIIPDPCCRSGVHVGSDYSKDIHTLDVKLAGLLPRLGVRKPGPARFLLLSLTYGSKGYRYSPEDHQERNLGLDVGLNLPEILRAVGVRDDTWWGAPILAILSVFRVPYTAFGFRYDFNHRKWSGWDTGDRFDPGSVIYD